jgi:hypothetical protein
MTILDLVKATAICGGSAYLVFNYPIIGQIFIIGSLTVLWLAYAHKTLATVRRR